MVCFQPKFVLIRSAALAQTFESKYLRWSAFIKIVCFRLRKSKFVETMVYNVNFTFRYQSTLDFPTSEQPHSWISNFFLLDRWFSIDWIVKYSQINHISWPRSRRFTVFDDSFIWLLNVVEVIMVVNGGYSSGSGWFNLN